MNGNKIYGDFVVIDFAENFVEKSIFEFYSKNFFKENFFFRKIFFKLGIS